MSISAITSGSAASAVGDTSKKSSGSGFQAALSAAQVGTSSAAAELDAYVKMTPAQRMRADALNKLGLKESDLDAMTPEQRKEVEDKIANLIKKQIEASQHKPKTAQATLATQFGI